MISSKTLALPLAAALSFASIPGTAWSHHGFNGRYDLSAPVWIEGELVEAYFGQPHSQLRIRIAPDLALPGTTPDLGSASSFLDAGSLVVLPETLGQTIVLELPPTRQYSGLGDQITVGDRIAAVAVRNCEAPYQLNGQWLRLTDGEVVARSGPMSYMADGC